jgi:hypothetical protein
MRRLSSPIGVIPRGFPDHRGADAKRYRAYCLAIQDQWGPLPAVATSTLREAGRAAVELERLGFDLESARRRKRVREARTIRKQQFMLREQLARLERRLEELGATRTADPLRAVRLAVAEAANR